MTDDYTVTRRTLLGYAGTAGALGLAGCSKEESLHEERMRKCGTTATIQEGQQFGVYQDGAHYTIEVTEEHDDYLDVRAEVRILDEEGANKEAVDATTAYNRTISEREAITLDEALALYYIEETERGHSLCAGDNYYFPTTDEITA